MPGGGCIDDWEVLDLLSNLVDKSLVIAETSARQTRYRLLETVRQYAQDRLLQRGERRILGARHRDYFLKAVESNRSKPAGPEQGQWLHVLETEHDNLRLALRFCLEETDGGTTGLRMGAALWYFWSIRGHLREGREQLRALLAYSAEKESGKTRADALNGAGNLTLEMCDYPAARSLMEESLAIWRKLGEKLGSANALNNLGNVAFIQGDLPPARALYEQALVLYRELGEMGSVADTLNNLGVVAADQGDFHSACLLYEESVTVQRNLGNRLGLANALGNLGRAAHGLGDDGRARALHEESLTIYRELEHRSGLAYVLSSLGDIAANGEEDALTLSLYEECLTIFRDIGDRRSVAKALNSTGWVLCRAGDYSAARLRMEESLIISRDLENPVGMLVSLEKFAVLAARERQSERAAQLWGVVEAARENLGIPWMPSGRQLFEREMVAIRALLNEAMCGQAWAEGRALTLEQAVASTLRKPTT